MDSFPTKNSTGLFVMLIMLMVFLRNCVVSSVFHLIFRHPFESSCQEVKFMLGRNR